MGTFVNEHLDRQPDVSLAVSDLRCREVVYVLIVGAAVDGVATDATLVGSSTTARDRPTTNERIPP